MGSTLVWLNPALVAWTENFPVIILTLVVAAETWNDDLGHVSQIGWHIPCLSDWYETRLRDDLRAAADNNLWNQ